MAAGEGTYGVSDLEYDLVMTLGNLLQGEEALIKYQRDAEQAGDQECAKLFQTIRENNRSVVQQVRQALQRHAQGGK